MADDDALVLTDIAVSTATITLNRPEKLNAITPAMLTALIRALETAYDNPAVKAIVLTGAGRAFSAGVDLLSLGNAELVGGAVGDILDLPAREAIRLLTEPAPGSVPEIAPSAYLPPCPPGWTDPLPCVNVELTERCVPPRLAAACAVSNAGKFQVIRNGRRLL
jgi:hypothetical protein